MKRILGVLALLLILALPEILATVRTFVPAAKPSARCARVAWIVAVPSAQKPGHIRMRRHVARTADLPRAYLRAPLRFLSTAPADSLMLLPGIGPVLAARIVDARTINGSFTAWKDLRAVPGIGPRTIAKLSKPAVR